ncbi:MAG: lysophospholipase [Butyricicoccus sp.]|nr:lysophospholipase [Butyricicoccus sp.]
MPVFSEFTFLSCNGRTNIRVRRCDPDRPARGVVQIAHGIAEHVERYDDFAGFLAENGFAVAANDHLGHGRSVTDESELGFFAENGGWELAVGDMRQLHEGLKDEFPTLPIFLFGHSMGSFLSRTYIIRYPEGLTGTVLCGTGQQPKAVVSGGRLLAEAEVSRHGAKYKSQHLNDTAFGNYNDGFAPARTVSDWLSRDAGQVDKYTSDPLCGFLPTAGLFRDMMGGLEYIGRPRNIARMKKDMPVLFISGDRDPVGENGRGVIRAYHSFVRAGMQDVTLKLYAECRHELLNELNREQVKGDVLAWINSKMPG